jgi:hypothetical protein
LFRDICLAAPAKQPTASAFQSKCACFSESIGDMAKRIADWQSAQKKKKKKKKNKNTKFYFGTKILLLGGVISVIFKIFFIYYIV